MSDERMDLLLPYQKAWIRDPARVKVYEKSRRIGASWAEASDAVMIAAARRGSNYYYMSYNKDMTRQFIEDVAFWARALNEAASAIETEILNDEGRDIQVYQVNFPKSKHHVQALSGSPRNLRSKQGVFTLDEAAFVDDIRGVIKAAMAFLMWGGRVRIISTHNGVDNPFNELLEDARAGKKPFSLHRTTLDEALADGLYQRICQKEGRTWTPEAEAAYRQELIDYYRDDFEEELFCIPSQSGGRYIPRVVLEAAMKPEIPVVRWACPDGFSLRSAWERDTATLAFCQEQLQPLLAALPQLPSFLGEDFGRSGDLTVLWPAQRQQNLDLHTPFVLELRNVPFEQQRQILFYVIDRLPNFWHGALDARGNGQYLAEVAQQRYGPGRISQVMISNNWYLEVMPKLKSSFEDRKLDAPRDADILDDLRAIVVNKGIPQIPEVRTAEQYSEGKRKVRRHGDAAVAAAMAVYAYGQESAGPGWVVSGFPRTTASLLRGY